MRNELTTHRHDPSQPAIQAPLPVPLPRNPMDGASLQVDVLSAAPLVVTVSGEVDIATGPKLREELLGAMRRHGARLALDLGGVTFMDCAGINVLLAARRQAQLEGGWVHVARASRCVRKVLMLTGLHQELALAGPETAEAAQEPPSAYRCGYWPAPPGRPRPRVTHWTCAPAPAGKP
jgi:anti-sigma B factor antagonist